MDVYTLRANINQLVQDKFTNSKSFGIESNLTSNSSYDIAKEANKRGYITNCSISELMIQTP